MCCLRISKSFILRALITLSAHYADVPHRFSLIRLHTIGDSCRLPFNFPV